MFTHEQARNLLPMMLVCMTTLGSATFPVEVVARSLDL